MTTDAFPLAALAHQVLRPYIMPEELEAAGDFNLIEGYVRYSLQHFAECREIVLVVQPLSGLAKDQQYRIALEWSQIRDSIVELVRSTGGPIGPCFLEGRRVNRTFGLWNICGRNHDGSIFDPLADVPPYTVNVPTAQITWK